MPFTNLSHDGCQVEAANTRFSLQRIARHCHSLRTDSTAGRKNAYWETICNGIGDGLLHLCKAVAPAGRHQGIDCSFRDSS